MSGSQTKERPLPKRGDLVELKGLSGRRYGIISYGKGPYLVLGHESSSSSGENTLLVRNADGREVRIPWQSLMLHSSHGSEQQLKQVKKHYFPGFEESDEG